MIHQSHLHTALSVLQQYNGAIPFSHFIKQFFSASKKYGSKDRRQISSLCYSYFRLGHSADQLSPEDRILTGHFVCSAVSSDFLAFHRPHWNAQVEMSPARKMVIAGLLPDAVFPFTDALSKGVDVDALSLSYLQQPLFFLRLRPGFDVAVTNKLTTAGLTYNELQPGCLALPNASSVDAVLALNREAVVQDYNSQQVSRFFRRVDTHFTDKEQPLRVWDCCAASGGKSLLLFDTVLSPVHITATDVRASMLHNLRERFRQAGIKRYQSVVADLTKTAAMPDEKYDIIICDVPCTGSGTWARTPEQLCFFKADKTAEYVKLQEQITNNVLPHLEQAAYSFISPVRFLLLKMKSGRFFYRKSTLLSW